MPTCEVEGGLCTTRSAQLHHRHQSQLMEREYQIYNMNLENYNERFRRELERIEVKYLFQLLKY